MAIERKVTRAVKTGNIEKVRKILDEFGTHQPTLNNNANEILVGNAHMRAHFTHSDIALYKTLPIGVAIIKGYDDIVEMLVNFVMQHAAQTHMNWIQQIHMPIYSDMALTYKRMEVIKLLFRPEFGISVSGVAGAIKPILQHAELLLTQAHQKHKDESAYREIVDFLKNSHHRAEPIPQNIAPNLSTTITAAQEMTTIILTGVIPVVPVTITNLEDGIGQENVETTYNNIAQELMDTKLLRSRSSLIHTNNPFSLNDKIQKLVQEMAIWRSDMKRMLDAHKAQLMMEEHVAEQIQNIMDNPYQKAFYDTLQWELTGCYLSASLISEGMIPPSKTGILGKCGKLVKVGGGLVPMAGSIVKLIGSIMLHLDSNNQKKIFEHYKYLSCNLSEMSKIIEQLARELAIDPNFIITKNDGGIFGRIKDGLCSSVVGVVENLSTDDIKNMVDGAIFDMKQNFVEYSIKEVAGAMSGDQHNRRENDEIKKGEVAARIVAGIIHGKILSMTSRDMPSTVDDKVALLKGWVSSFDRPGVSIEQSIAETVLEHLKHEKVIKKCWKVF